MSNKYIFGDYEVFEYGKVEIDDSVTQLVKNICKKSFQEKRSSYDYTQNYDWNVDDDRTLAYKFQKKQFEYIYLVYKNNLFVTFSGLYLSENNIAFGGARRFSSIHSPITPYHFAYVIPLQLQRAKDLNTLAFVVPFNSIVREKYFEYTVSLFEKKSKKQIVCDEKKRIIEFISSEQLLTQRDPVICNKVLQHLIYKIIDPNINKENFFEKIR